MHHVYCPVLFRIDPLYAAVVQQQQQQIGASRCTASERYKEGSRPGARRSSDKMRIALAIEGGGMRGCVAAGETAALQFLGLSDVIDAVYGASAGSMVGAYFVA